MSVEKDLRNEGFLFENAPTYSNGRRFSIEPVSTHILVVDDDQNALQIAEKLLCKVGYLNPVLVDSGKKALEELRSRRFDVVLCEVHMPGMDGFQLVQQVKQTHGHISIFMMSSTEDLAIVYKCLKAGADHYLLKPLKENDLRGLWQTLWNKRRESIVLAQLNEETTKSSILQEKTAKLEREINNLKQEVDAAVELPIRIIGKEVEKLLSRSDLPAEIIVSTILRKLRTVDIYQQALHKFVTHSNEIDPISKRWLMDEISSGSEDDQKKAPIEWGGISEGASATLRDWDFDVWSYTEEQLLPLCEDMFNDFQLLQKYSIPQDKLRNFLLDVNLNYSKKNPYHNFRHAFDVTQTCYLMLTNGGAANHLGYLEILALLIAALVHDLGHPGVNNTFQVATGTQLAHTYNDKSVLENYHCSLAFTLMKKPENDILASLNPEQRQTVRTVIINCVLATDLVYHMEILGKWNTCVGTGFSKDNKDHRNLLGQIILKCADIANPGKKFEQAKYWAQMVQEEFFSQGDMEKERNLPISAFMDREKPALPRMQLNFIDFLVSPLFAAVKPLLPDFEQICSRLDENKKKWGSLDTANQKG